jgi:hypothetical protein
MLNTPSEETLERFRITRSASREHGLRSLKKKRTQKVFISVQNPLIEKQLDVSVHIRLSAHRDRESDEGEHLFKRD